MILPAAFVSRRCATDSFLLTLKNAIRTVAQLTHYWRGIFL